MSNAPRHLVSVESACKGDKVQTAEENLYECTVTPLKLFMTHANQDINNAHIYKDGKDWFVVSSFKRWAFLKNFCPK